jgi:poly[(R)-3-hydroxyalkanoate] polymerase subunit PhaC
MLRTYDEISSDVLSRITTLNVDVWPSKYDVVDEEGIFRLLHYHPLAEEKYRTPILIVYAFINRPYVLDMQPEISVVQQYLKAGFDVYMIDWGYPTAAHRFLDLDDYVDFIDRSVDEVKQRKNVDRVNLHGYCLGGTLGVVYTALRQRNIRNLILQAAPIDFHTNNTIALWARTLDPDKIIDIYHVMPGEFLNVGFLLLDPINLVIGKYEGFLDMISSEGMSSFLRMDQWVFDSPAIPGEAFRQYIKQWYHDNLVIKGEFEALGERVDLKDIEVPVLVLAAKFDHIVPLESQKAILDLVSSKDKDVYEIGKGHIGITTSRDSHKEFWPKVIKWIQQRSELRHGNNGGQEAVKPERIASLTSPKTKTVRKGTKRSTKQNGQRRIVGSDNSPVEGC